MVAFYIVYKQAGHDLNLSRQYDMSILRLYLDRSRSKFARDTPVPEPSTIEGKGFVVVLLILYDPLPSKLSRGVPGPDDVSFDHGYDTRCWFANDHCRCRFLARRSSPLSTITGSFSNMSTKIIKTIARQKEK